MAWPSPAIASIAALICSALAFAMIVLVYVACGGKAALLRGIILFQRRHDQFQP